jgi:hypothetical protein
MTELSFAKSLTASLGFEGVGPFVFKELLNAKTEKTTR